MTTWTLIIVLLTGLGEHHIREVRHVTNLKKDACIQMADILNKKIYIEAKCVEAITPYTIQETVQ